MKDEIGLDYSDVPERKWTWHFEEDHWMDCVVNSVGVNYYGTDWTCQSGGGYFGGFQTFEEFLKKGAICNMPKKTYKEVSQYLKEHRKGGGSTLHFVYVHEIKGFHLSGVFVHLDDSPIHVKEVKAKGKMTIFDGSITPGEHSFGFVFVLVSKDNQKKISGEVQVTVKGGTNQAILKTIEDDNGNLQTEIVED
ncbi:MAG: hypothetical protein P1Q69_04240 [Candidatus Thorarchaeota archaeon]|nr:hypothetical protein [Candidatus Thorarchaeota archaeon]